MVCIPEGDRVEKARRIGVGVLERPGCAAVRCLVDPRKIAGTDRQDVRRARVEGLDVAEVARFRAGTILRFQVSPPSTVSRTVPPLPLAHATFGFTALAPRSRADEPERSTTHWAAEFACQH